MDGRFFALKVRRVIGVTGIDMVVGDTVRDNVKDSKRTPGDAILGTGKQKASPTIFQSSVLRPDVNF
jgi:hypothetical protein